MSVEDLQGQKDELKRILQYQGMEINQKSVASLEKAARMKNLIETISSSLY
ncbi:MAG: hypothetical protein HGB36_09240 [Chlorobiaceae bacterium]|nr:hypothetical protein [Chlorobiaceae bacterium]